MVGTAPVVGRVVAGLQAAFARFTLLPTVERRARVFAFVRLLRERSQPPNRTRGVDVKSGVGGIRDLEFLVQALQLAYLGEAPQLHNGNTLEALGLLFEAAILDPEIANALREGYTFLQRVEHSFQIFDDRQVHVLPTSEAALLALSRQMFGVAADWTRLERELAAVMVRVRYTLDATTSAEASGTEVAAPTVGNRAG